MIDGIIFDLDGTLWNSTGATYLIWNEAFERNGIPYRMTYEKALHFMGMTMHTIKAELEETGYADDAERIVSVMSSSSSEYKFTDEHGNPKGVMLYDGCLDTLRRLSKRYKLFIVSNCGSGYIESFMETFNIASLFADIECFGRTGLSKADNIRLVVERNGLESAVYVGDTAGDERSAHSAGIPFIYANYGLGEAFCPDHIIYSLCDLIPICSSL